MNKIYKTITVVAIVCSCLSLNAFSKSVSKRVMGLERARHFHKTVSGDIYIQAASFSFKFRAISYQKLLQEQVNTPVSIRPNQGFYRVLIGPLQTAAQVRTVGQKILGAKARVKKHQIRSLSKSHVISQHAELHKEPLKMHETSLKGWYVAIDAGYQSTGSDQMSVGNVSGAPSPFDRDIYTANTNNQIGAGVGLGKRWERENKWFPFYSLGIRYQHIFASNISGQVIQYSLPQYTNYNYNWNVASDAITAIGKFDVIRLYKVLPYISGGAGLAINQASQYSEIALPGIIPRISPGFSGQNNSQFTYTFGAGLDFRVTHNLSLSAGYEFQDWGTINSGKGTVRWANQELTQTNYQSNKLLFSADYWFNA